MKNYEVLITVHIFFTMPVFDTLSTTYDIKLNINIENLVSMFALKNPH